MADIEKTVEFLAWQAGKWYLRRRLYRARRKIALAGVAAGVVVGAVVVAQRKPTTSN
jgi:hypothetical protein